MKKFFIKLMVTVITVLTVGTSAGAFSVTPGLFNIQSRDQKLKLEKKLKEHLKKEREGLCGILLELTNEQLHTMVICSDADYPWTQRNVIPALQHAQHTVLDPVTDLSPGQPSITAYHSAVQQSRNFVVVVSEDFRKDCWHNVFVFGLLVLTGLFKGRVRGQLLICNKNDFEIPTFISLHPQVTVLSTTSGQYTREIKQWADHSKVK